MFFKQTIKNYKLIIYPSIFFLLLISPFLFKGQLLSLAAEPSVNCGICWVDPGTGTVVSPPAFWDSEDWEVINVPGYPRTLIPVGSALEWQDFVTHYPSSHVSLVDPELEPIGAIIAATDISGNCATIAGQLVDKKSANWVIAYLQWGEASLFDNENQPLVYNSYPETIVETVCSLSPITDYNYRLVLINSNNGRVSYSPVGSFTTDLLSQSAPVAPTMADRTISSITLNTISNGEYRINSGAWTTNPSFISLTAGTSYNFHQRYASTGTQNPSEPSPIASFTTLATQTAPPAPSVASYNPTTITLNTISNGEYRINGGSWQTSPSFSGLTAEQKYSLEQRYQATANAIASPVSPVLNFYLPNITIPSVSTLAVSDLLDTSATLNANLRDHGFADTTVYFEYGKTSAYGQSSGSQVLSSAGTFSQAILNLEPSTLYYFRAVATNSAGTSYGSALTFTTTVDRCYGQESVTFSYNGQVEEYGTVSRGGLCWLDRNLGADKVPTAYNDHEGYGDLFQWGRGADGHQLIRHTSATTGTAVNGATATLSSTDDPGHANFITSPDSPYDWRSPQNNNLWQGATGINNPCPAGWRVPTETELSLERASWSSNNTLGAYASGLKWPVAGLRHHGSASLNSLGSAAFVCSSSVSGTSARYLTWGSWGSNNDGFDSYYRAQGFSLRCLRDFNHFVLTYSSTTGGSVLGQTEQVVADGAKGTAVEAVADSGYVFTKWSDGSTLNPRMDTNVTADLEVTAEFSVVCGSNISFLYNGQVETYGTVEVDYGGGTVECWLDRNLGADKVPTAYNDHEGYGDLFQWGRGADGHQLINHTSATRGTAVNGVTVTLSSTDDPGHALFITSPNSPYDWRSPQNNNLWQGATGINNPCPAGWRVPTERELDLERASWSSNNTLGAYASGLKWPVAGYRTRSPASLNSLGSAAFVCSSSVDGTSARFLSCYSNNAGLISSNRAHGFSLRCLRD